PRPSTMLAIRYFLSCASPDNPHLPSSPTRRSSDLVEREPPARRRVACGAQPAPAAGVGRADREEAQRDERLEEDLEHGPAAPVRDRKSTRLNSSHGSISYAVFRLKKKIPSRARATS